MVARALGCLSLLKMKQQQSIRLKRIISVQRAVRRRMFELTKARERAFSWLFSEHFHYSPQREVWTRERSSHWWEDIALTFTSEAWMQNFRMSQDTFSYVCEQLKAAIQKEDTHYEKGNLCQKRVAITLWFLATGTDYRTIGHLFGVSKATVCLVVKEVCSAIVHLMLPQYIKLPKRTALKSVVDGFMSDHGFPQCGGAVDGTHIPIVSPHECPADYYIRKGFHSVLMQGVVDHKGLFTDIYVGWPGRVHDARVFANSSLFQKGQNKSLFPNLVERNRGAHCTSCRSSLSSFNMAYEGFARHWKSVATAEEV